MDETNRTSVSSLKSRFEQLATREVKNGPEEKTLAPGIVRPPSNDRHRNIEEPKPRASINGKPSNDHAYVADGPSIRIASPPLPPKPKTKPRIEPPERTLALGPPRSPQLLPVPKQDVRRAVSMSTRHPTITVESPHSPAAPAEADNPHPKTSRPLLPPRSATVATSPGTKPPLSPRPVRPKLEDRPRTPDIPRTPPPPPARSPRMPPSSPFTTPPESRKSSPQSSKMPTAQPIPVPEKLKPATNGLQPPTQLAPDLPQRPMSPPEIDISKPILPPRPTDDKKVFERPPPSRPLTRPKQDTVKPPKSATTMALTAFPPPPKRTVKDEVPLPSRTNSTSNLTAPVAMDASSGTELDMDASSSETEITEKHPPPAISAYPDASRANRKPPLIPGRQTTFSTNMSIKHVCVSGPYVAVSSSDLTKVFNLKKDASSIWSYMHPHSNDGYKVTSMEFKPCRDINAEGSYLWIGTDKGVLMEFDLLSDGHGPIEKRGNVHTSPVNAILRCRQSLWTLDESGKCQVWTSEEGEISMGNTPKTFRVMSRWNVAILAGWRLWVSQGRQIQVYSPLLLYGDAFNVTQRSIPLPQGKSVGAITCGTTLPRDKDRIFLGHDDGKVSIYSQKTLQCIDVVPINIYNIITLTGVGDVLWAGFRTGMIYVYDTSVTPWRVCKDWDAHHKMKITHLLADQTSLWRAGVGMVISLGEDGGIKLWDGLLMDDWLGK